jgi:hypothetical protein
VSDQLPPTPGDASEDVPEPEPSYRPHRPAKPAEADQDAFPLHTVSGEYDGSGEYFTPHPPGVPYFPATPSTRTLDRTTALVAALVLTALLALAGWSTAAVAWTRGRGPAPAAARPSATAASPTAAPVSAPLSLAEAPCGPATTAAESQGLTELHTTPSATLDGSGADLRLKLRCSLSSGQFDLSVDLLRSTDSGAVDEFFDFHRRSALGGARSTGLPGLGERAFVTVDGAVGGRTTIGVDVAGNRRALSLVGTTSGGYAPEDAQALLVAIATAYLTAG